RNVANTAPATIIWRFMRSSRQVALRMKTGSLRPRSRCPLSGSEVPASRTFLAPACGRAGFKGVVQRFDVNILPVRLPGAEDLRRVLAVAGGDADDVDAVRRGGLGVVRPVGTALAARLADRPHRGAPVFRTAAQVRRPPRQLDEVLALVGHLD